MLCAFFVKTNGWKMIDWLAQARARIGWSGVNRNRGVVGWGRVGRFFCLLTFWDRGGMGRGGLGCLTKNELIVLESVRTLEIPNIEACVSDDGTERKNLKSFW